MIFLAITAKTVGASLIMEPSRGLDDLGLGERFEIEMKTSAETADVFGGVVDLHYDADVVAYHGAIFSPVFNTFAVDQREKAVGADGPTKIADISFSGLFAGTGGGEHKLLTFKFAAVAPGVSEIWVNPARTGFTGANMATLELMMPDAVEAVVTPVPAALPLLASALAGLGLWRARRGTR